MKIEKVNLNKIRVTITPDDFNSLNIDMETLSADSDQLHSFLFKVMERVKIETGFNPYHGQIVVEAAPSIDGVILIVTKISETYKLDKKYVKGIKAVKKPAVKKSCIYCFDSFESLCGALKLDSGAWLENGSLYGYENNFYIASDIPDDFLGYRLSEYISDKKDIAFELFLIEHGKVIAEKDALVNMSEKVKELC